MNLSKHFTHDELACPCCGKTAREDKAIDSEREEWLLNELETIRSYCGFPLIISSGYRCPTHNRSVGGSLNSHHVLGDAFDIICHGEKAMCVVYAAISHGWEGIGISQKGEHSKRFIHIDKRQDTAIWSY